MADSLPVAAAAAARLVNRRLSEVVSPATPGAEVVDPPPTKTSFSRLELLILAPPSLSTSFLRGLGEAVASRSPPPPGVELLTAASIPEDELEFS